METQKEGIIPKKKLFLKKVLKLKVWNPKKANIQGLSRKKGLILKNLAIYFIIQ